MSNSCENILTITGTPEDVSRWLAGLKGPQVVWDEEPSDSHVYTFNTYAPIPPEWLELPYFDMGKTLVGLLTGELSTGVSALTAHWGVSADELQACAGDVLDKLALDLKKAPTGVVKPWRITFYTPSSGPGQWVIAMASQFLTLTFDWIGSEPANEYHRHLYLVEGKLQNSNTMHSSRIDCEWKGWNASNDLRQTIEELIAQEDNLSDYLDVETFIQDFICRMGYPVDLERDVFLDQLTDRFQDQGGTSSYHDLIQSSYFNQLQKF